MSVEANRFAGGGLDYSRVGATICNLYRNIAVTTNMPVGVDQSTGIHRGPLIHAFLTVSPLYDRAHEGLEFREDAAEEAMQRA